MKHDSSRRARLTGACAIAGLSLAFAASASAQEAPPEAQAPEAQAEEEIVVTGTRVPRPDYAYSNPVVSVSSEAIQYSGATNLTDFLEELPALANSMDSNDAAGSNAFIGGTGLNLLNLRNLGLDRTLVLVNGRRHVAAVPGSAAVDTNTIPIDLIERVEVSTGGASAIYGADGVSGVVNFILDDDFDGFRIRAQAGSPDAGGGAESQFVSGVWGINTDGGRANLTIAAEYSHDSRLTNFDRDFGHGPGRLQFARNPFDLGDDPTLPDNVPLTDVRFFDSARGGAVDTTFDGVPDFVGDGTPWNPGLFIPPFFQQGGTGTSLDDYVGDLLPEIDRLALNAFYHFDFNRHARFFTELKYVNTQSLTFSQPSFDFFLGVTLDNPFIPDDILNDALANGAPLLLVSRDNFDLGVRGEDINRQTFRGVWGFNGEITDDIRYEASFLYGVTDTENEIINNRLNDRFAAALDVVIDPATGEPTCASNLDPSLEPLNVGFSGFPVPTTFTPGPGSGCVPLNIFGENASRAARDWIMRTSHSSSSISQMVAQAYVNGTLDSWFTLPGGSVGFAAGFEWRREESESAPAPEDQAGLTFGNVLFPSHGDYDVREAFAEISLPILEDRPFFDSLAIDAAIRLSDYSTVGETTTWKTGLVWAPISDITFRGTIAEAVRAPNIGELFDPGGQTFLFIDDPCDIANVNNGTDFRADNCAAILTALGIDPSTYTDPNSASIPGVQIGNPDLEEEIAETETIGVIFRPRFVPRLVFSVDWYRIELTNAINTATAQETADQCVDLPTLDNQFCDLLERDPSNGGISGFTLQPVNVASFTTEGYDFSASYLIDTADFGWGGNWGTLGLRLVGNKLEDLTFINLPGAEPDPDLGEANAPEWQVNFDATWEVGPFTLNYGYNYFSETQRFTLQEREGDPDIADPQYLDFDARSTHDLQARYRFGDALTAYAGVNNFTDQQPDIGELFYPVSAVGRFFYVGINAQLN